MPHENSLREELKRRPMRPDRLDESRTMDQLNRGSITLNNPRDVESIKGETPEGTQRGKKIFQPPHACAQGDWSNDTSVFTRRTCNRILKPHRVKIYHLYSNFHDGWQPASQRSDITGHENKSVWRRQKANVYLNELIPCDTLNVHGWSRWCLKNPAQGVGRRTSLVALEAVGDQSSQTEKQNHSRTASFVVNFPSVPLHGLVVIVEKSEKKKWNSL